MKHRLRWLHRSYGRTIGESRYLVLDVLELELHCDARGAGGSNKPPCSMTVAAGGIARAVVDPNSL